MVLVTVVAVLLSYAVAFAIYANERGAAIRRATETAVIDRVAYTAERLRDAPAGGARPSSPTSIRDFGLRYRSASAPSVEAHTPTGVAPASPAPCRRSSTAREVRASARVVEASALRRRFAR